MKPDHQVLLASVGAAVRRLREDRSLTRRELAQRSGVSERFLADLEGGAGNISVARLQDVSRALGTSAGELLFSAQHERTGRRAIALVGLRGAGKSTIGRALASRLRLPFVELDALVEKEAGLPLAAIFQLHGEAYYRRLAREVLTRFLAENDAAVIATGGGIVTDPGSFKLLQKVSHRLAAGHAAPSLAARAGAGRRAPQRREPARAGGAGGAAQVARAALRAGGDRRGYLAAGHQGRGRGDCPAGCLTEAGLLPIALRKTRSMRSSACQPHFSLHIAGPVSSMSRTGNPKTMMRK